jgi:divalent metal cation (Fe/Co/Zn/Cd) transporter
MEAHDITIFEQDDSLNVSLHLKFPADLDLREAAQVAERVERRIRAGTGMGAVQTHLEPLERTLSARPADAHADRQAAAQVERLVRERTGLVPQNVKLLSTEAGRVLFLTLGVNADETLASAHTLAGELEEELRLKIADIAEVVIHTEP